VKKLRQNGKKTHKVASEWEKTPQSCLHLATTLPLSTSSASLSDSLYANKPAIAVVAVSHGAGVRIHSVFRGTWQGELCDHLKALGDDLMVTNGLRDIIKYSKLDTRMYYY